MNHDDFEQELRRQPLRQIPAEWRAEILGAATSHPPSPFARRSLFSTLNAQLAAILWPHPAAWAGLAAVWIFIFAVDFSTRDNAAPIAGKLSSPTTEVMVEVRQQQRLLAELIGPRDVREADRSKSLMPRPRSEYAGILAA